MVQWTLVLDLVACELRLEKSMVSGTLVHWYAHVELGLQLFLDVKRVRVLRARFGLHVHVALPPLGTSMLLFTLSRGT